MGPPKLKKAAPRWNGLLRSDIDTERGANLKRPQPHAVAHALHASQTGKADALGEIYNLSIPANDLFTLGIWSLAGGSSYFASSW